MPVHRGVEFYEEQDSPMATEIDEVEALLGVHLDDAYLALVRVAHAANTDAQTQLPDRPLPVCFGSWFALSEGAAEVERYKGSYFGDRLPDRFLPLALTGAEDDVLFLRLDDEGYGEVWAWMSGLPPGWHRPTEDALLRLAASLDEYLDSLLPPDED